MGQYVFKLPDVGEGTAEAEIVAWHVRVGDVVAEDAPLVDVMTDKATVEMTAPVSGKVVAIHGEPGDMAPVGGPIAVFETDAEESEAPAKQDVTSPASGGGGASAARDGGGAAAPVSSGAKPRIRAPAGATWSEAEVQAAMNGAPKATPAPMAAMPASAAPKPAAT